MISQSGWSPAWNGVFHGSNTIHWSQQVFTSAPSPTFCCVAGDTVPFPGTHKVSKATFRDPFEMQKKLNNLQGKKRTWFSGSYFGYGFHEDGLKSSLEMLKQFEGKDGDLHIQRHSYASKI